MARMLMCITFHIPPSVFGLFFVNKNVPWCVSSSLISSALKTVTVKYGGVHDQTHQSSFCSRPCCGLIVQLLLPSDVISPVPSANALVLSGARAARRWEENQRGSLLQQPGFSSATCLSFGNTASAAAACGRCPPPVAAAGDWWREKWGGAG